MKALTERDKRKQQLMRELGGCIKCFVVRTHPFHDDGSVNEGHVDDFRKENPVFDKDAEARKDAEKGND